MSAQIHPSPLDRGIEALPCALLGVDAAGVVRAANPRLCALVGRPRRKLEGLRLDALLSPGSAMLLRAYVLPLLQAQGAMDEISLDLRHADGSDVPVLASAQREGQGPEAQVVFVVLPAPRRADHEAELRRLGHELDQARQHLAQANADLERFAAGAAHDLSEPMRKVQAFGDRLAQSTRSTLHPSDRDYLARMLNAAQRMQAMIDGLQQLAHTGQAPQADTPLPLPALVAQVLAELDRHVVAAGAEVRVGELLPHDVAPGRLGPVLQQLLGNALKFRRDGVAPRIRIESGETGDGRWWLSVQDNGIGFAPEHAGRLFEPFLRLHDRQRYPGSGLGLATAQRIVHGLGGEIRAEGEPESGARFILTLPVGPA